MNGKIEIIIRGASAETEEASSPTGEAKVKPVKKEEGKTSTSQKALNAALISVGKQMIMNSINQLGATTGNTIITRKINSGLSLAGDILTIIKNGSAGMVLVAGERALYAMNSEIQRKNEERTLNLALERSGNLAISGSRK